MRAEDPVVERVREARRQIVAECGGDAHRLYERLKEIEGRHRERVVGYRRVDRKKDDARE